MSLKSSKSTGTKVDIYEVVTNRILEKMEQGQIPWQKPWDIKTGAPCNVLSGKPYRGINVMMLGSQYFDSKYWLTFKQCIDNGGKVRKGERGTPVVFWNFLDKKTGKTVESDTDSSTLNSQNSIPMLRYYTVFNVNQCENLDLKKLKEERESQSQEKENEVVEILSAQDIIDNYKDKPEIREGYTKACYIPSLDEIHIPKRENFKSTEEYFSTVYHECCHSTGHESRLNRKNSSEVRTFGDEAYSKEELVAEMGAAYLCAVAGIENKIIDNSSAYIQSWMKVLQNDKRLLITAAGQAQKATAWIVGDVEHCKQLELEQSFPTVSGDIQDAVRLGRIPAELVQSLKGPGLHYSDGELTSVITKLAESPNSELIARCTVSGVISSREELERMIASKSAQPQAAKSLSV